MPHEFLLVCLFLFFHTDHKINKINYVRSQVRRSLELVSAENMFDGLFERQLNTLKNILDFDSEFDKIFNIKSKTESSIPEKKTDF